MRSQDTAAVSSADGTGRAVVCLLKSHACVPVTIPLHHDLLEIRILSGFKVLLHTELTALQHSANMCSLTEPRS